MHQLTLFGLPYQVRPGADRIAIAMSLFAEPRSEAEAREWDDWVRRRAMQVREAAALVGEGLSAVRLIRNQECYSTTLED